MMRTRLLLYFIESMNFFFLLLLRFFNTQHTRDIIRGKGENCIIKKKQHTRTVEVFLTVNFLSCVFTLLCRRSSIFQPHRKSAALHKKRRELDLHYHLVSTVSLLFSARCVIFHRTRRCLVLLIFYRISYSLYMHFSPSNATLTIIFITYERGQPKKVVFGVVFVYWGCTPSSLREIETVNRIKKEETSPSQRSSSSRWDRIKNE